MKRLICLLIVSLSFAAIEFSGDARFRPRLDVKKYGVASVNNHTSDLYYLYRARINMKVDIGEGWFLSTKLGTNDIASMVKMSSHSTGGGITSNGGNFNSFKPDVNFLELYYGYTKENSGLWVGTFPLKYTPALDLHFYSEDKLVDIPFVLYNNSSINGFAGYQMINDKKVNWFLSVDLNLTNIEEDFMTGNETIRKDTYTIGFNSSFDVLNFTLTPNVLVALGEGNDLPKTFGLDIELPQIQQSKLGSNIGEKITGFFSSFSSSISYHMLSISSDNLNYADHFRIKITRPIIKGNMKFFYDIANMEDDSMSYMWLSYTHTCYKGDAGTVTISPTYRYQDGGYVSGTFDEDYNRTKFEITTEIKFF